MQAIWYMPELPWKHCQDNINDQWHKKCNSHSINGQRICWIYKTATRQNMMQTFQYKLLWIWCNMCVSLVLICMSASVSAINVLVILLCKISFLFPSGFETSILMMQSYIFSVTSSIPFQVLWYIKRKTK